MRKPLTSSLLERDFVNDAASGADVFGVDGPIAAPQGGTTGVWNFTPKNLLADARDFARAADLQGNTGVPQPPSVGADRTPVSAADTTPAAPPAGPPPVTVADRRHR